MASPICSVSSKIGLERAAENAAERVDLLAGEGQPVLEFDAVRGGEIGERRGLAHGYGCSCCARSVVDAREHGRGAGQATDAARNRRRLGITCGWLIVERCIAPSCVGGPTPTFGIDRSDSRDRLRLVRLQVLLAPVRHQWRPEVLDARADAGELLDHGEAAIRARSSRNSRLRATARAGRRRGRRPRPSAAASHLAIAVAGQRSCGRADQCRPRRSRMGRRSTRAESFATPGTTTRSDSRRDRRRCRSLAAAEC